MAGEDALARLFVQHLVGLNQLENLSSARVLNLIKSAFNEVNDTLTHDFDGLTKYQRGRQLALYKRSGSILTDAYGQIDKVTKGDLFDLSQLETRFAERTLRTSTDIFGVEISTTRLGTEQLKKIIELPIQGFTRSQWWESQAVGMSNNVKRQIQLGLFAGEPVNTIAKRITDVTANRAGNEARAIVRTAVTGVATETHFATLSAQGEDVTDEYMYVATLDDRTSEICASLDGNTYKYDDEQAPRPPQHINCRSTIVAVINWEAMGISPGAVKGMKLNTLERAAQGGPTKYKDYESWLIKQPLDVKQEVLGNTKGQLFHDGDISLKDLIKTDKSVITTAQLAKKLGLEDKALGAKAKLLMEQNAGLILPGETKQFTFKAPKSSASDVTTSTAIPDTAKIVKDHEVTAMLDELPKPKLNDDEFDAIHRYQGSGYSSVNGYLRGKEYGADIAPELKQRADDISSAIEKSKPIPENAQVYRAVGGRAFTGVGDKVERWDVEVQKRLKALVGKTFTDKAFVSTTTDRGFANQWGPVYDHVLFEIKLPKGTKALWVPKISDRFPEEAELLLKAGSKFKVVSVENVKESYAVTRTIVRLELLP